MDGDSLKGRIALVTGGAKRLGRAIGLRLAGYGANVVIHFNKSKSEADRVQAELGEMGVQAWTVQADFTKPPEYESLIDRAVEKAGSIDILVNSASVFPSGTLDEISLDDFMKTVEINAWVPFVLARAFVSRLGKNARGGIVNILDTRVVDLDLAHPAYAVSKKMLYEFTKMAAIEFAPNVTVNAVAPGLILPPAGRDMSYLESLAAGVPLKRHGSPEDVASAVAFLVGSEFITGQTIFVDGGRHLREHENG